MPFTLRKGLFLMSHSKKMKAFIYSGKLNVYNKFIGGLV